MNLSINFDFFKIFKIDTQIHTQKLNFYSLYLIILFEICKRFTNTQIQSSKLKTQILKYSNTQKTENPNLNL